MHFFLYAGPVPSALKPVSLSGAHWIMLKIIPETGVDGGFGGVTSYAGTSTPPTAPSLPPTRICNRTYVNLNFTETTK